MKKHYWTNSEYTRVYLGFGYKRSVKSINELSAEAAKDFPEVSVDEHEVEIIQRSSRYQGYCFVTFLVDRQPPADYQLNQDWPG
jgi:hypothetical protein